VGAYSYARFLSSVAPDGTADWQNYALATASPGDTSDTTGCSVPGNQAVSDRNDVILYALDKSTGALYESVNPNVNGNQSGADPATSTLIGTSTSFWVQLTVPWSGAPTLVQADINSAGSPELWTQFGSTATAYTISSTTVTQEGSGTLIDAPNNDWPLEDGAGSTTALDTSTASADSLEPGPGVSGGSSLAAGDWSSDPYFGTVFGQPAGSPDVYIAPPSGTVSQTDPTISVWFRTSAPTGSDGVLVSLQADTLSTGPTTTGGYDPVMYVGTDGKLHALWYQGAAPVITSSGLVDDGAWHHAVLSGNGTTQTLTLDGVVQGTASGTISLSSLPSLDFGAGFIGGPWIDETNSGKTGAIAYFDGEIADITFTQ
jgi:hypothetical protein